MIQNSVQHFSNFARFHDEIPAFHVFYAVLTLLAAAMFSIGTFGVLIIAHMVLDIVKYREVHKLPWSHTLKAVVHESLLDCTLLAVALLVSVYFHSSVGFIQLSGLLRAELSIVQFLGVVLPKFIILEHLVKVFAHIHHYLLYIHPHAHKRRWSKLDKIYFGLLTGSVLLLLFAPMITRADPTVITHVVLHELQPFRL